MDQEQRNIVCTNYRANADSTNGRAIALYEREPETGKLARINKDRFFCDEDDCQVYVMANHRTGNDYSNFLEQKYSNRLYQLQCVENKNVGEEARLDFAKNKSNLFNTESIEPKDVCEVIEVTELPNPFEPVLFLESSPLTRHIFLRDEQYSYGPFEYETIDDLDGDSKLKVILKNPTDTKYLGKILTKLSVFRFNNSDLDENFEHFDYESKLINGIPFNKSFYHNLNDFRLFETSQINYGFVDEIEKAISTIIKETNTKGISPNQVALLATRLKNKKTKFNFDTDYVISLMHQDKSFEKILRSSKEELNSLIVSNILLSNESNRAQILKLLKEDEDLLTEAKEQIKEEKLELDNDIIELKRKQNLANQELQETNGKIEKAKKEQKEVSEAAERKAINELKNQKTSLNEEIDILESRKKKIDEKYQDLFELDSVKQELETVTSNLADARSEYDSKVIELMKKNNEISTKEEEIRELQRKEADEYKKGLLNVKSSIDVLTQFSEDVECIKFETKKSSELTRIESKNDICDFVKYSQIVLSDYDRQLSIEFLINILVCLDQSFITIFSGLPGTGKTSLATLLNEKVLKSRFNKVQVGRGWTSERDLLGYFNPITNKYVSSGTGMYEYLETIAEDNRFNVVLLDEANLSPLEHYWSKFMGISDDFQGAEVKLSSNKAVSVGNGLRFIATINNDMTTEPLSPRLLDRSPCIRLDVFSEKDSGNLVGLDLISESDKDELRSKFQKAGLCIDSIEQVIMSCNSSSKDSGCDDIFEKSWDTIQDIQKRLVEDNNSEGSLGPKIYLSPRRMLAIRKYFEITISIYSEFSINNSDWIESAKPYLFLDYAISEFVLPLITGHGKAFKKRLIALLEDLQVIHKGLDNSLTLSVGLLETLIGQGEEDLETYDYMSLR